jgi:hypothetical protein
MAIQWKVGALSAWIAFAVIWISVAGWINYGPAGPGPWDTFADLEFPRSEVACREAAVREPKVIISVCIENARKQNWRDGERVAWTFLPPLFIFLLGGLSFGFLTGRLAQYSPKRPVSLRSSGLHQFSTVLRI